MARASVLLNILDATGALLCLAAFVLCLWRMHNGEHVSLWVVVSMPIIALTAMGRLARRRKSLSTH